jgi:pimeloyl-ACP methyl ester carboxylesterase
MPTQRDVAVDGVTLVIRVWPVTDGTRPPLVLLPGTAATAHDWDAVAAALHATRTVHAVNLRGHGPSDWPGTYFRSG